MVAARPDIRKDIYSHGRRQPIALPGLIAISWRQLSQTIDRRTGGNIYRHLETEPTAIRSIVINTGNPLPPCPGDGERQASLSSEVASCRGKDYRTCQSLAPAAKREDAPKTSINCANAWSREGVSSIETEQSFDRLIFEGYREGQGRADNVIVDRLKVSQNRTVEMD